MPTRSNDIAARQQTVQRLIERDPMLAPYVADLRRRAQRIKATQSRLTGASSSLAELASGHEYFGLHFRDGGWVLREWAPNATSIHLKGPFSDWRAKPEYALTRGQQGVWEVRLAGDALAHGDPYRLEVGWPDGSGDRLPAWVRRVVQDPSTRSFNAQVWRPEAPYQWRYPAPPRPKGPLLVYEAHVGMAQEELKSLIDEAHRLGLLVFMDLVHSHAARNEVEGISRQDGSESAYFHEGVRGQHPAWNSRCFDYGKPQVLHFLLSNCRFWMDEHRIDGFRFDGVTSMLHRDHGLGHPEWIDFPREGNGWSYAYARRQWHLASDETLRFPYLGAFDRDAMALARTFGVPDGRDAFLSHVDVETKILAWLRGELVFVMNFHPSKSFPDYRVQAAPGTYRAVLDTDRADYGGFERRDPSIHHHTLPDRIERQFLSLYLPSRTGLVLQPVREADA